MPIKGDIMRGNQKYYLTINFKKKFFLKLCSNIFKFMPNINLIHYIYAGFIFGALALKTGISAAPLAGALNGSSILTH